MLNTVRPRTLLGIFFLVLYPALCVISGILVAENALHPGRKPLVAGDEIRARALAYGHHSTLSDIRVSAKDGAILRAWSVQHRNSNGKAVVLLHGLSDNRLGIIAYAELLVDHGFSVLMPDARAHGNSGGQLATYGLLESDDIGRWFDWMQRNQHPLCTFGFAESIGGAQLLQSLQVESRFCAVVAESPFSSLREIAYDRVGQFFHTGPWLGRTLLRPVVEVAFVHARWKYQLNLDEVAPDKIVAKTRVAVLLIHGRADSNIPIRHSLRMAAENSRLVFWEVADAGHCGAITTARAEFEQSLVRWFDAHSHAQTSLETDLQRESGSARWGSSRKEENRSITGGRHSMAFVLNHSTRVHRSAAKAEIPKHE